ncbi:hypothetical protein H0H92_015648, partial [Tricholoma furcatifolium]
NKRTIAKLQADMMRCLEKDPTPMRAKDIDKISSKSVHEFMDAVLAYKKSASESLKLIIDKQGQEYQTWLKCRPPMIEVGVKQSLK